MNTTSPFGGPVTTAPTQGRSFMEARGLRITVHMPPATKSRMVGREEGVAQLAPFAPVEVYKVDDNRAPSTWARSDEAAGLVSYFVEAEPDHMIWFDLRQLEQHPHLVAARFSSQGVCALTRQPMAVPLRLEQHPQNYITSEQSPFWRDGFMAPDGITREFIFTEERERGVAAALLGDARVNAFGIALWLAREPKPRPAYYGRGPLRGALEAMPAPTFNARSLEVGAGARVNQTVRQDSRTPNFWHPDPVAAFTLYYVTADELEAIVGPGTSRRHRRRDNGFGGAKVGNP